MSIPLITITDVITNIRKKKQEKTVSHRDENKNDYYI